MFEMHTDTWFIYVDDILFIYFGYIKTLKNILGVAELLESVNSMWYVHHISLSLFYAYDQNKVISKILSTLGWWWWCYYCWLPVKWWWRSNACAYIYPRRLLCKIPRSNDISTTSNYFTRLFALSYDIDCICNGITNTCL